MARSFATSNIAFSCSRASPGQGPVEREPTAPVYCHHRAQGHQPEQPAGGTLNNLLCRAASGRFGKRTAREPER